MTPRRKINRRDLLQGKLWKLYAPAKYKPLVMRYPRPGDLSQLGGIDNNPQVSEAPKVLPRMIGGIAIDPVAPTNLTSRATPRTIPVFRPPGAIEEQQFLAGCTRCGDCITVCPYDALRKAPERLGAVAGTPIIEAFVAAYYGSALNNFSIVMQISFKFLFGLTSGGQSCSKLVIHFEKGESRACRTVQIDPISS